jgi:hypothetical protein
MAKLILLEAVAATARSEHQCWKTACQTQDKAHSIQYIQARHCIGPRQVGGFSIKVDNPGHGSAILNHLLMVRAFVHGRSGRISVGSSEIRVPEGGK